MDGSANGTAAGHDRLGRFTSGHNEYAARRRRVADWWQQLCADYDDSSPTNRQLLLIVAQHLDDAAVTRIAAKRARSTHAAMKILDRIPRKPKPSAPSAAADQAAQVLERNCAPWKKSRRASRERRQRSRSAGQTLPAEALRAATV
jgi:hypothetical protein